MMAAKPRPPTIASLKAQGVVAFRVTCAQTSCLHSAFVIFEAAAVDDGALFPSIAHRRRFVCGKCGGRSVSVMPDWRTHRAQGLGGVGSK